MKIPRPQNIMANRRQRRIQRRRKEIMDAAAGIFAEQGYANTTTKAIAESADMAEGTLYNYFESKHHILMAILEQHQQEIDTLLDEVTQVQSHIGPVTTVEWIFKLLLTRVPFFRVLLAESWTDDTLMREHLTRRIEAVYQRVKSFVIAHIESGVFRKVDPDLATQMLLGICLAPVLPVIRGMVAPPSDDAIHALAVSAVDLMLHGLEA